MGNGRGKIDCVYCTHFIGDWQHEAGVLYEFPCPNPPDINKLAVLRDPAFDTWDWKPPKST